MAIPMRLDNRLDLQGLSQSLLRISNTAIVNAIFCTVLSWSG
ncbi:MAG: hypothetical protein VKJ46_05630 [Leptolyngbyaceae bacterium]|nr:hypothetical protein [Leptolyngbyaceae bacterium]